jgi:hypothetical protein
MTPQHAGTSQACFVVGILVTDGMPQRRLALTFAHVRGIGRVCEDHPVPVPLADTTEASQLRLSGLDICRFDVKRPGTPMPDHY